MPTGPLVAVPGPQVPLDQSGEQEGDPGPGRAGTLWFCGCHRTLLRPHGADEGDWSSGMIPALGAGGREFDSRITPFMHKFFV